MTEELEIEFKNLLSQEHFHSLCNYFSLSEQDFKQQVNHYFDTDSFTLKDAGCALRIREKNSKDILTFKQPAAVGILETHQPLHAQEKEIALHTGELPPGPVQEKVEKLIVEGKLAYFGSLTTFRAEKKYKSGLIVLDYSRYLNKEDYEIEFEVSDYDTGREQFADLLSSLNIPFTKTKNKVRRFYEQKYQSFQ
ncbi:CYTH domain-containing protein [Bacillus lacus]|uniref:CYTH domain-containing protein n=1 Tax=Metabacillus lacus TaxID=1983721 RepID=A0A7X2M0T7_9BACI|nr:CYTH domain-containing protein [Metabacillus lacus]MRX73627.1 CYTH domain-containing protein [Metabacillus lacus]